MLKRPEVLIFTWLLILTNLSTSFFHFCKDIKKDPHVQINLSVNCLVPVYILSHPVHFNFQTH